VIRTHPVTGFKTLYVNKTYVSFRSLFYRILTQKLLLTASFTKRIVELTPDESDNLLNYLFRHISENHDLQVGINLSHETARLMNTRCTRCDTAGNSMTSRSGTTGQLSTLRRMFFF
jgi:alpha-ketoglutarate-dependent taurine dioxygenase